MDELILKSYQFRREREASWQELDGLLADRDPEWFYTLVPQDLAQGREPTATTEAMRQKLYEDPTAAAKDRLSIFASYLLLHNSAVGIAAFALGVALGVPTVLLMLDN